MTFLSARLVILFTRARDGQNVAPLPSLPLPSSPRIYHLSVVIVRVRACLYEGGGSQTG